MSDNITNNYYTRDLISTWFVKKHFIGVCAGIKTFPIAIISIIVQYFSFDAFEWNPEKSHNKLKLTMENTIVTAYFDSGGYHQICTSKNTIDPEKYSFVEWELTLLKQKRMNFGIGFLEQSLCKSVEDWSIASWMGGHGFAQTQISVTCFHNNEYMRIYSKSDYEEVEHEKALIRNIKIGDRFGLLFDLNAHQCSFYFNDEFMQILSKSLLGKYPLVPGACFGYSTELQTTKWNVVFRK